MPKIIVASPVEAAPTPMAEPNGQVIPIDARIGDTNTYQNLTERIIAQGNLAKLPLLEQGLDNRIREADHIGDAAARIENPVDRIRQKAIKADIAKNNAKAKHLAERAANRSV